MLAIQESGRDGGRYLFVRWLREACYFISWHTLRYVRALYTLLYQTHPGFWHAAPQLSMLGTESVEGISCFTVYRRCTPQCTIKIICFNKLAWRRDGDWSLDERSNRDAARLKNERSSFSNTFVHLKRTSYYYAAQNHRYSATACMHQPGVPPAHFRGHVLLYVHRLATLSFVPHPHSLIGWGRT